MNLKGAQAVVTGASSGIGEATATLLAAQLGQQLSFVEKEFVDAADVMPEDRNSFVPTNEFPNGTVIMPKCE